MQVYRKIILILALTIIFGSQSAAAQTELSCQKEIIVQINDWLSKIAEKFYGNPLAYPAIVQASNQMHVADSDFALIENPNLIEPGWRLCIISNEDAVALLESTTTKAQTSTQFGRLILATTTSTENSGLLSNILPDFEEKYDVTVDVIAVGTGQAIELGRRGDADVILVHARSKEDNFIQEGNGLNRQDVMYNDFVILGPANDPAKIAGMTNAAAALLKISQAGQPFISRGDESGTHIKELSLWAAANVSPNGEWYQSAGQGMGAVLTLASEQQAYTLSDRGTYLARTLEGIDMVVLVEDDPRLFNPYGVIAVNPINHPTVNYASATALINWLTSIETQKMISEFGVSEFGVPLFIPDSQIWQTHQN